MSDIDILLSKRALSKRETQILNKEFEKEYPEAFKYSGCFCSSTERTLYVKKVKEYLHGLQNQEGN